MVSHPTTKRGFVVAAVCAIVVATGTLKASAAAADREVAGRAPLMTGFGGAVATVDPIATRVGLEILRQGGNAVDAAIAAAATLGVVEPLASGIGGGGFLLYYDANSSTVNVIDGRESAPAATRSDSLVNPGTGRPFGEREARVSGMSVGVPGTPMTWAVALRRWGTLSRRAALAPAVRIARRGFVVDRELHRQIESDREALGAFRSTRPLFTPGGHAPAVGSTFRNPDLADTYDLLAKRGLDAFYSGEIARDIVQTVRHPPTSKNAWRGWRRPIRSGKLTLSDLASYEARFPKPTRIRYRGLEVYGVPPPSTGGSTIGETLNILTTSATSSDDTPSRGPAIEGPRSPAISARVRTLHRYFEASSLAFADRDRFVADWTSPALLRQILSTDYARERARLIDPNRASRKPVAPGIPDHDYGDGSSGAEDRAGPDRRASRPPRVVRDAPATTNLTVADRWGDVVEYTLTLERLGGNAMVVPGRGFLLNNELTDFTATSRPGEPPDPNLPAPGKRPRSSMAPTLLLRGGKPFLALGSPGGATIITTVTQVLVNRLELGMALPAAVAAPRASQRDTATVLAEPGFVASPQAARLAGLGHRFTTTPELGAVTAIEFLPGGRLLAVAEERRRGGGAAAVVRRAR